VNTNELMRNIPRKNRRKTPITLNAKQIAEEILSAEEFLLLAKENPGNIKSSKVILPSAGTNGFGTFLVRYAYPRYVSQ
jgi:hypothetical protein